MKNVTISLPEEVWAELRAKAAERQVSLNAYVGQILRRATEPGKEWSDRMQCLIREARLEAQGKPEVTRNWTREELYDREVLR
jgi:plasmid stability protein